MPQDPQRDYAIRPARSDEFAALGQIAVAVYAALPGMPGPDKAPDYYQMLADVSSRAGHPAMSVFAAVRESGELLGSVDFIRDVKHYGTLGAVTTVPNAAGIRLLAVKPECRGQGVGKALTSYCIEQARGLGRSKVVLHTTQVMQTAWGMYERLGFQRFPEIDFRQGSLDVYGFQLKVD